MDQRWPQWTDEITKTVVTGEDHLGVDSAATTYQQWLIPGVITTTDHARYYSFYAWVLHRFIFAPDSSRLLKDFRGVFYKRHEAALIAASYSHHKDKGVLGGLVGSGTNNSKARTMWENGAAVSLDFNYFQNDLGGFGQYYRTVMQEMGIVGEQEGPKWIYSLTDRGKQLAEAYEQSIEGTAYLNALKKHGTLEKVSRAHATEYGELGCICPESLSKGADRELLRDAFFRFDQADDDNPHVRRRLALGVVLDIVRGGNGKFDRGLLWSALYLGQYAKGQNYVPAAQLASWAGRWRMVVVRQLYSFGLQSLWAAFLLHLREQEGGLSFEAYLEWTGQQLGDATTRHPLADYLSGLCGVFGLSGGWQDSCRKFDTACRIETGQDELSLFDLVIANRQEAAELLRLGVRILTQQFLRCLPRHLEEDPLWSDLAGRERLPISGFFETLHTGANAAGWTVGDWLRGVYKDYILGQHEFIALEKLRFQRYDTFKFYYRDGLFYWPFREKDAYTEPIRLTGLRLFNVITILTDLGLLVQAEDGTLSLSSDGQDYHARVLRSVSA